MDWGLDGAKRFFTHSFLATNHADVAAAAWTIEQSFKGGQVVVKPPG